jgi:hypothetical protein
LFHPNVLTFSFFALANWIYQWYDPKGPVSPSALIGQLTTFLFQGIYGETMENIRGENNERSKQD